ncbi:MAG: hypothetical protein ABJF23_31110 [Bryobacteraceae bacterium]
MLRNRADSHRQDFDGIGGGDVDLSSVVSTPSKRVGMDNNQASIIEVLREVNLIAFKEMD